MACQVIYQRVGFTYAQLTRLQHDIEISVQELGHQLVCLVTAGVINPVIGDQSCLESWRWCTIEDERGLPIYILTSFPDDFYSSDHGWYRPHGATDPLKQSSG